MGLLRLQQQLGWTAEGDTTSLIADTTAMRYSDPYSVADSDVAISIQIKADKTTGSGNSGDQVTFGIAWSNGDLNADAADDYDSAEYVQPFMVLDLYASNTPGEDPATRTLPIDPNMGKSFKLTATYPIGAAGTHVVTVWARLNIVKAS